ncbi:MAG: zinc ribbon domain-containing protein, partial [Candidatus Helarchaeota archaeon]
KILYYWPFQVKHIETHRVSLSRNYISQNMRSNLPNFEYITRISRDGEPIKEIKSFDQAMNYFYFRCTKCHHYFLEPVNYHQLSWPASPIKEGYVYIKGRRYCGNCGYPLRSLREAHDALNNPVENISTQVQLIKDPIPKSESLLQKALTDDSQFDVNIWLKIIKHESSGSLIRKALDIANQGKYYGVSSYLDSIIEKPIIESGITSDDIKKMIAAFKKIEKRYASEDAVITDVRKSLLKILSRLFEYFPNDIIDFLIYTLKLNDTEYQSIILNETIKIMPRLKLLSTDQIITVLEQYQDFLRNTEKCKMCGGPVEPNAKYCILCGAKQKIKKNSELEKLMNEYRKLTELENKYKKLKRERIDYLLRYTTDKLINITPILSEVSYYIETIKTLQEDLEIKTQEKLDEILYKKQLIKKAYSYKLNKLSN